MKDTLPDGSQLKAGEMIFKMQRPIHGQKTLPLRSGPASRYISPDSVVRMVKLAMAEEFRLEALQPQPDGFVGGKGYCSAASICRAHPDIPYATVSTGLRNNALKNIRSVAINGSRHVHPDDVARAISQIKKMS